MPSHYYNYLPFGEVSVSQNTTNYNNIYRFSAKELDDETQLSYFGARYYDARLSYWLGVDSEFEKNIFWNPYSYCEQSPIMRFDPDGNDDIFNKYGRFVRSTKTGNEVKIKIGNKLYTPSQLSTSIGSRKAMANIAAYYASKIGVDKGTMISSEKTNESSSSNPAFTRGKKIYLNINGGFSKQLNNISNFKNILVYENQHKEDNERPLFKSTLSNHADVYIKQMSDTTFSTTTDEFKIGVAGSFANYLLNMDKGNEFGNNDVLSKIEDFNSTNTGGMKIIREGDNFGNYSKGSLDLNLIFKKDNYPVKYIKLDE